MYPHSLIRCGPLNSGGNSHALHHKVRAELNMHRAASCLDYPMNVYPGPATALQALYFIFSLHTHRILSYKSHTLAYSQYRGAKRWAQSCVNMMWKNCVLLPAEGIQNATFHPVSHNLRAHLLDNPCRNNWFFTFCIKMDKYIANSVHLKVHSFH